MTTHVIKQVPDFPFKKHVFGGAALALDWVAHLHPEHVISGIWEEVQKKADILDDFAKPFDFKQKAILFKTKIDECGEAFSKKSLELVREGTASVKLILGTVKAVDKYALSFLSPGATTVINAFSGGASLVASSALVGIRAHGLYEKSNVDITGEKALVKASARFLSSIYGLVAAIILVVALFVSLPAATFIILAIMTLIFLTNLIADVYVKF